MSRTCPQCGRDISNRGEFVRFCSQGCENAYKRENPDIILGLVGKAIGNAVAGAQDRSADRAQEESERRAQQESERAHRAAERLEEERAEAEARASASAARHVIQHEVMCLECGEEIVAKVASDGQGKVVCKHCKTKYILHHSGDLQYIGPAGRPLTGAEDFHLTEDRFCRNCKYYGRNVSAFTRSQLVIGKESCSNSGAVSAALEGHGGSNLGADTNPNNRCRFWEKRNVGWIIFRGFLPLIIIAALAGAGYWYIKLK